eukprot:3991536-Alexandrium_andersonii.AAC.1
MAHAADDHKKILYMPQSKLRWAQARRRCRKWQLLLVLGTPYGACEMFCPHQLRKEPQARRRNRTQGKRHLKAHTKCMQQPVHMQQVKGAHAPEHAPLSSSEAPAPTMHLLATTMSDSRHADRRPSRNACRANATSQAGASPTTQKT